MARRYKIRRIAAVLVVAAALVGAGGYLLFPRLATSLIPEPTPIPEPTMPVLPECDIGLSELFATVKVTRDREGNYLDGGPVQRQDAEGEIIEVVAVVLADDGHAYALYTHRDINPDGWAYGIRLDGNPPCILY